MGLSRAQLTAIAKATGYPVRAAWVAGHGVMGDVAGVMLHHTATPDRYPGDYPSLKVVTKGRPDLPGPLCNYGLGRSGTIYLVSEGIAWHAGPGAWRGVTSGNTHFLGIEAENAGTGAPWPAAQLDAYQRLVASILHAIGCGTDWDIRHATWALPPGRKTDTAGIDMGEFDARVRAMLADPRTINRNASTGDDDMTPQERAALVKDVTAAVTAAVTPAVWNREWREYYDRDHDGVRDDQTAADALVGGFAAAAQARDGVQAAGRTLDQVLAEQRRTNDLLEQLVGRLPKP